MMRRAVVQKLVVRELFFAKMPRWVINCIHWALVLALQSTQMGGTYNKIQYHAITCSSMQQHTIPCSTVKSTCRASRWMHTDGRTHWLGNTARNPLFTPIYSPSLPLSLSLSLLLSTVFSLSNKRAQKSNFHFHFSFTNTDWRKNFLWKRCMQSIFYPTFLLLFFPLLTYPLLRRLLRIFYSSNQSLNQSFANSQDFTHLCSKEQYCLANTNKFQCSNEIFEYISSFVVNFC